MRATGRMLSNFAFLFALAVWGGAVVFFTFITTPIVFADLDRDMAAGLLGHLFPRFFQVQIICSAIALAFIAARLCFGAPPRKLTIVAGGLLTVALAIALYNNFVLLPDMTAAQERVTSFVTTTKDDPARVAYGQLHGRAMILNGLAALLGGATLALAAFDPRLLTRRDERTTVAQEADATSTAKQVAQGRAVPSR